MSKNRAREARARRIVEQYAQNKIEANQEYTVSDVIADLLHYARSRRYDVERIIFRARDHFEYERSHPNE